MTTPNPIPPQIENQCGVLFPNHGASPRDENGCRLPHGHDGMHEFVSVRGNVIQWETDMNCNCHCCQQDDSYDWCAIYKEVK